VKLRASPASGRDVPGAGLPPDHRARSLNPGRHSKNGGRFSYPGPKAPAWPIGLTSGSPALRIEKPGGSAGFFVDRIAPSFNGRTAASGAAYRGSNPWGATSPRIWPSCCAMRVTRWMPVCYKQPPSLVALHLPWLPSILNSSAIQCWKGQPRSAAALLYMNCAQHESDANSLPNAIPPSRSRRSVGAPRRSGASH
jgi:hypothetical protein